MAGYDYSLPDGSMKREWEAGTIPGLIKWGRNWLLRQDDATLLRLSIIKTARPDEVFAEPTLADKKGIAKQMLKRLVMEAYFRSTVEAKAVLIEAATTPQEVKAVLDSIRS